MKIASIAIAALLASTPAMANETNDNPDLETLKAATVHAYDIAREAWGWRVISGKPECSNAMRSVASAFNLALKAERQMAAGQHEYEESIRVGIVETQRSMKHSAACLPGSYKALEESAKANNKP